MEEREGNGQGGEREGAGPWRALKDGDGDMRGGAVREREGRGPSLRSTEGWGWKRG